MNLSYNEHVSNDNMNLKWRRASRCESGSCVEVAFVKASRSSCTANCVEVRECDCGVQVRDSKNPGVVLTFTAAEWDAFLAGVFAGEFNL